MYDHENINESTQCNRKKAVCDSKQKVLSIIYQIFNIYLYDALSKKICRLNEYYLLMN